MNITSFKQKSNTSSRFAYALLVSQFLLSPVVNALDVSINGSPDLSLNSNITYNHQTTPSTMNFSVDSVFLCSSINNSNSKIILNINDSNNIPINTLNNGILSTTYDLANNRVTISTDASIQCASPEGLHNETIISQGFEQSINDLEIELLDVNGFALSKDFTLTDQQVINYKYQLTNNGNTALTADLVEFYKFDTSIPHFSGVIGDEWVCNTGNTAVGSNSSCGTVLAGTGEDLVRLKNATIDPSEQLIIDISRTAIVPANRIGTPIELLAAAFNTSDTDTIKDNNIAYNAFGTTDNHAPEISSIANVEILEDGSTNPLSFTISDAETPISGLSISVSSSNRFVVANSNIVFGGLGGSRTVQINPVADANTPTTPVTIRITVGDGITTSTSEFQLTVTPVNDAPTFTLQTIEDWDAGSSGLRTHKGFVQNLSTGASNNETLQVITNTVINVTSDENGIFDQGGEPQLSNNGVISYVLSGVGGTATIDVQLQDNGGTDNGGADTSEIVSFNISVLNTLAEISEVEDVIIDEDTSTSAIEFTISDAETDAIDLIMTATSSNTDIIDTKGIVFTGTEGTRFVQITPELNQNTVDSGPIIITLIVDDGSNTSQTEFTVSINPINDAPSFTLSEDPVDDSSETGLLEILDFATLVNLGPTTDEDDTQSVLSYEIEIISGADLFDQSVISVDINNNGTLKYILSGLVGVATIEVTLQDDGGIDDGGVDTTEVQAFTITVNGPS